MAKPEGPEDGSEEEEELGEWFESFDDPGNAIPSDETSTIPSDEPSAVSEEGEVSADIPEVSLRDSDEINIAKKLESRPQADVYETEKGNQPFYKAKLPDLSQEEREIMNEVREQAIDEIEVNPDEVPDEESRKEIFMDGVMKMLKREEVASGLSEDRMDQMATIIVRDMIGFGLLDVLLDDNKLEEIMVSATEKPVYVYDRDYGMCVTNVSFEDEEELVHQIEKMARNVGRRIDKQNPLLDATLPDGSRVNATIPPISLEGPTLTIRKFREDPLTIVDIIEFGTLTVDVGAFLWLAVDGMEAKPSNLLVAGGTASGKSTTLNTLTSFVRDKERVISIEDTAELNLPHEHWIRLETRAPNVEGKGEVDMEELVENSLRMRPDRIIVGEVRGPEAMTMFTGMNTGHDGCMGTVHSNSAKETITRLTEPPMNVPNIMVPALDAVVMQQRMHHHEKGQIRRVTEISELTGFEEGQPQLSQIYKWDAKKDKLESTGVPSTIKKNIAEFAGVSGKEVEREIQRRATVLQWMKEKEITDVEDVGEVFQKYYRDPQGLLDEIESESLSSEDLGEDEKESESLSGEDLEEDTMGIPESSEDLEEDTMEIPETK